MDGICLEKEIVYKAETKVDDKISYIGLTASTLKKDTETMSHHLIIANMNTILVFPNISGF